MTARRIRTLAGATMRPGPVVLLAALLLVLTGLPANAQPSPTPPPPTTRPSLEPPQPPRFEIPGQQPTPAPSTTSPPDTDPPGIRDSLGRGPAFYDLAGRVRQAMHDWLVGLVTSALHTTFTLMAGSLTATPQIGEQDRIRGFWTASMGLANGLLVLLIVLAGATVMGYETIQTRMGFKESLQRIVITFLVVNTSLVLCDQAIRLTNALSTALLGQGFQTGRFTERLRAFVDASLSATEMSDGSDVILLMGLVTAVLAVILLLGWAIRAALVILLALAAPLALAGYALPASERVGTLWCRAFAACMGVQLGQALALAAAVHVFLAPDGAAMLGVGEAGPAVNLLVASCLLLVLILIPVWAIRLVLLDTRHSPLRRVATYYTGTYLGLRALRAARRRWP